MFVQNFIRSVTQVFWPSAEEVVTEPKVSNLPMVSSSRMENIKIPTFHLTHVVLKQHEDGNLELIRNSGETFIFDDESSFDQHIFEGKYDIWEIVDERQKSKRTIYKYPTVWDEVDTFIHEIALLNEIASETEHGVFCIDRGDQKKEYYIKRRRWFQSSFDKVILKEEAANTIAKRTAEAKSSQKCKAIGIALLALSPLALSVGEGLYDICKDVTSPSVYSPLSSLIPLISLAGMTRATTVGTFSIAPVLILYAGSAAGQECPNWLGGYSGGNAVRVAVSPNGIAHLTDRYRGYEIFDISGPGDPQLVRTINLPGFAEGIKQQNNLTFIGVYNAGLYVYNSTDELNPQLINVLATPANKVYGVTPYQSKVYVGDDIGGMHIVNIGDLPNLSLMGTCATPNRAGDVVVDNDLAIVTVDPWISFCNVTDPFNPFVIRNILTPGGLKGIARDGNYLYVTADNTMLTYDIGDISNVTFLSSRPLRGYGFDIALKGNYLFVADAYGLRIFDKSNSSSPEMIAEYNSTGYSSPRYGGGVAIHDKEAVLADWIAGIQRVNISCLFPPTTSTSTFSTTTTVSPRITSLSSQSLPSISSSISPSNARTSSTLNSDSVSVVGDSLTEEPKTSSASKSKWLYLLSVLGIIPLGLGTVKIITSLRKNSTKEEELEVQNVEEKESIPRSNFPLGPDYANTRIPRLLGSDAFQGTEYANVTLNSTSGSFSSQGGEYRKAPVNSQEEEPIYVDLLPKE